MSIYGNCLCIHSLSSCKKHLLSVTSLQGQKDSFFSSSPFQVEQVVKNPPAKVGNMRLIPGFRRSPGGGNGNLLQHSCLEIPWTEKPGRLQPVGLQRVGHNWVHKRLRSPVLGQQDTLQSSAVSFHKVWSDETKS